jgi:hypothetical protein
MNGRRLSAHFICNIFHLLCSAISINIDYNRHCTCYLERMDGNTLTGISSDKWNNDSLHCNNIVLPTETSLLFQLK